MISTNSQLYQQISSKLIVEDDDLGNKMEAFKQIETMFKEEMEKLQDVVRTLNIEDQ